MAKYALLIGVSEYLHEFSSLSEVTLDIQNIKKVLESPEIGNFTQVQQKLNQYCQSMREGIEEFFSNRQPDDLLLLYFSGHGIVDDSGKLYLASHETHRDTTGALKKATAIDSRFVQERMNESRSRRQVLILDCCFSGAFSEGLLAKNDGVINIKHQLGGEGRAILTSSTSIEYSYEGFYTRYIVEGLETGAADRNQDGEISVDELHEYAKYKIKETGQAMTPQIYATKEGYKITLANAPVDDKTLKYRREVEDWISSGEGKIPEVGRIALDDLREQFKLSEVKATEIEEIALAPIKEYKKKLDKYEGAFEKEIQSSHPINIQTRNNLNKLQKNLKIKDEDISLIESRILIENQKHKNKTINKMGFLGLPLAAIGIFIAGFYIGKISINGSIKSCKVAAYPKKGLKISLGEKILLEGDTNGYKVTGIESFLKKDYKKALKSFTTYRTEEGGKCINDPEALIYLNNARALQDTSSLRLAVSVPIGSNQNVAKEILRGVAQAQSEINYHSGIHGKLLQVKIANDDNDPTTAGNVATQLAQDLNVLAVIGHNASNASISAAPVYSKEKLVAISPTSYAKNLSNLGTYVYRMTPPVELTAVKLANYIIDKAGKKNILFCYDMDAIDSFASEFKKSISNKLNPTECELSKMHRQKSEKIIFEAIQKGADSIVFSPYIDRIGNALEIVHKASTKHLSLFGSFTLYTSETLQNGKNDVNNLIVVTPWHPNISSRNSFPSNAKQLWGGPVNWRTAMAYDATMVIAQGLRQKATREGVQTFLRAGGSIQGTTGKVNFLESGDRGTYDLRLIKVQPSSNEAGYEFVLLPRQ
jgi:branched-chain amino acid transport system substrate-binding protein